MKNFTFILLLSLLSLVNSANAQAPAWQWARSAGDTSYNYGLAICTDALGYVYVAGIFDGEQLIFGKDTLKNSSTAPSGDIFLVKYDSNGNTLWARSTSGRGDNVVFDICTDFSGHIYLTGKFDGHLIVFGNDTLTNSSSPDENIFIAKYDTAGNEIWAKNGGGAGFSGENYGYAICAAPDGSAYITGTLYGALLLAKYDSSGSQKWSKSGVGVAAGFSISVDDSSNVYLTGRGAGTMSFDTITLSTGAHHIAVFIAKYDSQGNAIWAKSIGGFNSTCQGICIQATKGVPGYIYVSGEYDDSTIAFGHDTLTVTGFPSTFIAKYDLSGNLIWAENALSGKSSPAGISIDNTHGDVFLTGVYNQPIATFGGTTLINGDTSANDITIFVSSYDSSGAVLWVQSVSGYAQSAGQAICADAWGNVYVTGQYDESEIIFGADTLVNTRAGYYTADIFVAKLASQSKPNAITSTAQAGNIQVFPNPTTGIIYFKGVESGCRIEVYDVLGQIVHSSYTDANSYSINLSANAKGVYFYRVTAPNTVNGTSAINIQDGKIIIE